MTKRLLDLFLLSVTAPAWLPALGVVALLVRLNLGRPLFFRQRRPGLGGRVFELIKFRTMTRQTGPDGRLLPDAERLTRFGRWLRSTSLDELPEVLNVIRGEMSLVGPRPLLVEYLARYSPEQARRHLVRPGLTGWAQVNGRNALTWEEKFRLDVWYVDHRSLGLDLRILLLTVWQVLGRHGVNAPGMSTMSEFMGSPLPKPAGNPPAPATPAEPAAGAIDTGGRATRNPAP